MLPEFFVLTALGIGLFAAMVVPLYIRLGRHLNVVDVRLAMPTHLVVT
jgi:hypothetical protein